MESREAGVKYLTPKNATFLFFFFDLIIFSQNNLFPSLGYSFTLFKRQSVNKFVKTSARMGVNLSSSRFQPTTQNNNQQLTFENFALKRLQNKQVSLNTAIIIVLIKHSKLILPSDYPAIHLTFLSFNIHHRMPLYLSRLIIRVLTGIDLLMA